MPPFASHKDSHSDKRGLVTSLSSSISDFYAHLCTTQWFRVAGVIFAITLAISYGIGFSIGAKDAKKAADDDLDRRTAVFNSWQTGVTTQFTRAEAFATTVAAYGASTAYVAANLTAPAAAKLQVTNKAAFDTLCSDFTPKMAGIFSIVLTTGGVLAQVCPAGSLSVGLDTYTSPNYASTYREIYRVKGAVVTGPTRMATVKNGISINSWFPIFINGTTLPRTNATYWGAGWVIMELNKLIDDYAINSLLAVNNLDYVLWYTDANDTSTNIVRDSTRDTVVWKPDGTHTTQRAPNMTMTDGLKAISEDSRRVMTEGMRIKFPASEVGKEAFLAMYPRGGPVSAAISGRIIAIITVAGLLGASAITFIFFLILFTLFMFRHRKAPAFGRQMYMGVVTLRGAQPVVDKSPLDAVDIFNEFGSNIRQAILANGCYPICDVGDRSFYVVSKTPEAILKLAQDSVLAVQINAMSVARGRAAAKEDVSEQTDAVSHCKSYSQARSTTRHRTTSFSQKAKSAFEVTSHQSKTRDETSQSSFIGSTICHASAAIHTITARGFYDSAKDLYFYGTAAQLGKLCGAVDGIKGGEVGWTQDFDEDHHDLCAGVMAAALTSHCVSENGEVVLTIASWLPETGDERDNEDPSVAMAAVGDAYVKRMTTIVSQGRDAMKAKKKQNGGGSSTGDSSNKSADATSVTRNATLLHIAIIGCEGRMPLDIIRRIVAEEKGAVISAHENVIVAAFNLLTPGGHHQVRAADTVMRLQATLVDYPFVCSIHHGKVTALIVDGLVMCSGDVVAVGKALLDRAIRARERVPAVCGEMHRRPSTPTLDVNAVKSFAAHSDADKSTTSRRVISTDGSQMGGGSLRLSRSNGISPRNIVNGEVVVPLSGLNNNAEGLCFLLAQSELSSTYDCEAADILPAVGGASKAKIVFRLAHRKAGKGADDEWMYQLKDEEDQSPFAAVNAVFTRILSGDLDAARLMWERVANNPLLVGDVSPVAQASIVEHLSCIRK